MLELWKDPGDQRYVETNVRVCQGSWLVVPKTHNCKELYNMKQRNFLPNPPGQAAISLLVKEVDI